MERMETLRNKNFYRLANQLAPRVAKHLIDLGVHKNDVSAAIGNDDPIRGRFQETLKEFLG